MHYCCGCLTGYTPCFMSFVFFCLVFVIIYQIKSNQIYFAINSVHNITMSLHCIWLDRQAITSRLCLPMTPKP